MEYKNYMDKLFKEGKLRLDRDVCPDWERVGETIIEHLNKEMKYGVGYTSSWRYSFLTINLL